MARNAAKAHPALVLGRIRQLHIYVSVFIAPTMMFFALTGALQTFRIADKPNASDLLVKLTHVHRDDQFIKPAKKPPPKSAEKPAKAEAKPAEPKAPPPASKKALQWFFLAVSLSFIASSLLGLWMALAYHKRKALLWLVLIAGAAAPVLILTLL